MVALGVVAAKDAGAKLNDIVRCGKLLIIGPTVRSALHFDEFNLADVRAFIHCCLQSIDWLQ